MQVARTDYKGDGKYEAIAEGLNHLGRLFNAMQGDLGVDVYNVGESIRFRNLWPPPALQLRLFGLFILAPTKELRIYSRRVNLHHPSGQAVTSTLVATSAPSNDFFAVDYSAAAPGFHDVYLQYSPDDGSWDIVLNPLGEVFAPANDTPVTVGAPGHTHVPLRLYRIHLSDPSLVCQLVRIYRPGDIDIIPLLTNLPVEEVPE